MTKSWRGNISSIGLIVLLLLIIVNPLYGESNAKLNPEIMKFSPSNPNIVNISVMDGSTWRDLGDNTWIPARNCQTFRIDVHHNDVVPENLILNYWVEKDHDANLDRVADISEYAQVSFVRQTESNESVSYTHLRAHET